MAITEYNYIPTYIKRTINNKPKDVIRASYWNELFNLLINQGDHTAKELGNVLNHFTAAINEVKGIADDKYVKPTDGIPKTDLAAAVQTSLDKADSALQTHQSLAAYRTAFDQDVIDSDLGDRISAIENKESGWDGKQDKLIAGENITIAADGKTISSTGGGAKAFFLNVFVITETEVVTNKTYTEIKAAIDAGDIIYITDKNGIVYAPQVGTTNTKIELLWIESQGNRTLYWTAVVDSENAWSAAEFELVEIDKLVFELSDKVDKETGKGLSTNDYTYADKAKVDALKPVATSGSYNDLTNKPTIPTTLPNPHKLTINGTEYDGSADVQMTIQGADGKSAYQYAQEGGYTGTEAEFVKKLASGALIVAITDNNGTLSADKSYIEIRDAILAGTQVLVLYDGTALPLIAMAADLLWFGTIMCTNDDTGAMVGTNIIQITPSGEVNDISAVVETLPNPNAITFTGAVTGSYDGSAPMTVKIPSAVTDDHINSLIDTKLGVIENGSY